MGMEYNFSESLPFEKTSKWEITKQQCNDQGYYSKCFSFTPTVSFQVEKVNWRPLCPYTPLLRKRTKIKPNTFLIDLMYLAQRHRFLFPLRSDPGFLGFSPLSGRSQERHVGQLLPVTGSPHLTNHGFSQQAHSALTLSYPPI